MPTASNDDQVLQYASPAIPPESQHRRIFVKVAAVFSIAICCIFWLVVLVKSANDLDWKRSGGERTTGVSVYGQVIIAKSRALAVTSIIATAWVLFGYHTLIGKRRGVH